MNFENLRTKTVSTATIEFETRGVALLKVAGDMKDDWTSNQTDIHIAKLAMSFWQTINGDCAPPPSATASRLSDDAYGICSCYALDCPSGSGLAFVLLYSNASTNWEIRESNMDTRTHGKALKDYAG